MCKLDTEQKVVAYSLMTFGKEGKSFFATNKFRYIPDY